jgi:flagellar protein FliO/FliZ
MIKTTLVTKRVVFSLLVALNLVAFSKATFGAETFPDKLSSEKVGLEKIAAEKAIAEQQAGIKLQTVALTDDAGNAEMAASTSKTNSEKAVPFKSTVAKSAEKADFRNNSGISFGQILQLLGALIVIVGLIILSAWLARKFGSGMLNVNNSLKITAVLPLGNKEKIAVLEVEGVKLIVGVTAQSISTLHVLECPPKADFKPTKTMGVDSGELKTGAIKEAATKGDFAQRLQKILSNGPI